MRLSLDRDAHAPSLARAAVRLFIQDNGFACAESAAVMLLVSELVSNAVLHSDAPPAIGIVLCARLLGRGALRVEVTDRGSGFAASSRRCRPDGGYGLFLVDMQASCWGVDREGGTRVWFELESPGHGHDVS